MNGQKLQVVNKFTYLGSTLSRAVHIDDEVSARTVKASVAFGRLRTSVWERNGIRLDTKLKVYKAAVLPTFYKPKDIGYQATSLSTYDFSTLYTTLPHNLIKEKLFDLIERTFYFSLKKIPFNKSYTLDLHSRVDARKSSIVPDVDARTNEKLFIY